MTATVAAVGFTDASHSGKEKFPFCSERLWSQNGEEHLLPLFLLLTSHHLACEEGTVAGCEQLCAVVHTGPEPLESTKRGELGKAPHSRVYDGPVIITYKSQMQRPTL
jgi:hypothetical protein